MDVLLWQAMCGHNTNGSVGLHKHTHKLKQQFSLANQSRENSVTIHFCNFLQLLDLLQYKYQYCCIHCSKWLFLFYGEEKLDKKAVQHQGFYLVGGLYINTVAFPNFIWLVRPPFSGQIIFIF